MCSCRRRRSLLFICPCLGTRGLTFVVTRAAIAVMRSISFPIPKEYQHSLLSHSLALFPCLSLCHSICFLLFPLVILIHLPFPYSLSLSISLNLFVNHSFFFFFLLDPHSLPVAKCKVRWSALSMKYNQSNCESGRILEISNYSWSNELTVNFFFVCFI